jgi:hypothetical protein
MPDQVRLQLMVGPAVAMPAPRFAIDALQSVTVTSSSGGTQSGFELRFSVPKRSPLQTMFMIGGGASIPIMRVIVAVTVRGTTTVLIDGVMTHHELQPGSPSSTLVVRGKDLSAVMDIIALDGLPFPAMPPAVRVLASVAKYAALGVLPMVIPSVIEDVPIPTDRIPSQQGTDYAFITGLAREAGYVFYIDPGPVPGTSKAYWGPELRVGTPQPALNAGLDGPHDNVKSLAFRFDKERKQMPVVFIQEPITKAPIPIPIPDITPLNPPLGLIPPLPPKITLLKDTAKLNPLAAAMKGLAYASQHADAVFGTGSLDVVRYGHVLRSRALVGVRGAGDPFNGLHYVTSVTSKLRRGEFTQEFTLARNGLLSTVGTVPGG